jgi:hypothetical protein
MEPIPARQAPRRILLALAPSFRWRRLAPGRHFRLGLVLNLLALVVLLDRATVRMPMILSRRQAILDELYGAVALAAPADYWIALSTTTPTDTGGNFTEPVGNAYARVQKTNNATNWPAASAADPTVKSNGNAVTFPAATGSWGTVTHAGWYTVATVGTPVDWAALTASQAIGTGATASFATSQLQTQLDAV